MSVEMLLIPIVIAAVGGTGATIDILSKKESNTNFMIYETKMKDYELLKRALEVFGHKPFLEENYMDINLEEYELIFKFNDENIFEAVFRGNITQEHAEEMVSEIYGEYTKLVQEQVYYKVLENIQEHNMELESESIQDDNSIVLTLNIQEKEDE
ncbi:MAG TPA: hypothetical protein VHO92_04060 [Methanobacterium sp.]|nr:hypothetical protein [Methanobacterium sp.]